MSNDRLEFIKSWYADQQLVQIEIPPFVRIVQNKKVTTRFEGIRFGYQFKEGKALIKRDDLFKFQATYPDLMIVQEEAGDK
jgi:hypothetical protein